MDVLYGQPAHREDPGSVFLELLGVKQCYFKHFYTQRDAEKISTNYHKAHHHYAHYELHMVESGHTVHQVDGVSYRVESGHFLLFAPLLPHQHLSRDPGSSTFYITFQPVEGLLPDIPKCFTGPIPEKVYPLLQTVLSEYAQRQYGSSQIIAAALAQILLLVWRSCGVRERALPVGSTEDDPRLVMAVQYIRDNIEYAPTVEEVSDYCHISTKHLTRLFLDIKGMVPSEYIRRKRMGRIELLLRDSSLSLQDISDRMHFSGEGYLSTFFKKHSGMTPLEYRIMNTR